MSGSALSVSPVALGLAVLGYILKRWWDNADALVKHRKDAYSQYFEVAYTLAKDILHNEDDGTVQSIADSYELYQAVIPNFLLHASPNAIVMSDELFSCCLRLRDADRSTWSSQERDRLVEELGEALGVFREVLKEELYIYQPRFLFQRYNYNKKWRNHIREIEERNASSTR